ncbi:MAG: ankyrin repeat domain-containing protein [Oligoflexia bacterium]|nr:ankyrin repeat domain-containing protein [Oligoflexia bacterium]
MKSNSKKMFSLSTYVFLGVIVFNVFIFNSAFASEDKSAIEEDESTLKAKIETELNNSKKYCDEKGILKEDNENIETLKKNVLTRIIKLRAKFKADIKIFMDNDLVKQHLAFVKKNKENEERIKKEKEEQERIKKAEEQERTKREEAEKKKKIIIGNILKTLVKTTLDGMSCDKAGNLLNNEKTMNEFMENVMNNISKLNEKDAEEFHAKLPEKYRKLIISYNDNKALDIDLPQDVADAIKGHEYENPISTIDPSSTTLEFKDWYLKFMQAITPYKTHGKYTHRTLNMEKMKSNKDDSVIDIINPTGDIKGDPKDPDSTAQGFAFITGTLKDEFLEEGAKEKGEKPVPVLTCAVKTIHEINEYLIQKKKDFLLSSKDAKELEIRLASLSKNERKRIMEKDNFGQTLVSKVMSEWKNNPFNKDDKDFDRISRLEVLLKNGVKLEDNPNLIKDGNRRGQNLLIQVTRVKNHSPELLNSILSHPECNSEYVNTTGYPDASSSTTFNALAIAIYSDNPKDVSALLEHEARLFSTGDYDARNSNNYKNCYVQAIETKKTKALAVINDYLAKHPEVDAELRKDEFFGAVENLDLEGLKKAVNNLNNTAKDASKVKEALAASTTKNSKGETLLQVAIRKWQEATSEDKNIKKGLEILNYLTDVVGVKLTDLLSIKDVRLKSENATLLTNASYGNFPNLVKRILEHPSVKNDSSYINEKDRYLQTALMVAAALGHDSIVTMLLEKNPDISIVCGDGNTKTTAFEWAKIKNQTTTAKLIQDYAEKLEKEKAEKEKAEKEKVEKEKMEKDKK